MACIDIKKQFPKNSYKNPITINSTLFLLSFASRSIATLPTQIAHFSYFYHKLNTTNFSAKNLKSLFSFQPNELLNSPTDDWTFSVSLFWTAVDPNKTFSLFHSRSRFAIKPNFTYTRRTEESKWMMNQHHVANPAGRSESSNDKSFHLLLFAALEDVTSV